MPWNCVRDLLISSFCQTMIQKSTKVLHFQGKLKSFFSCPKDWLTFIQKDLFIEYIKPENILISITSDHVTLKWADFGLTKDIDEDGFYEMSGQKGTLYWMAPEIWAFTVRGRGPTAGPNKFTCASDVFSAGCLFFHFVTGGVHPFGSIIKRDVSSNIESNNPINLLNESELLNQIVQ